jgi:hypothetical protein
MDNNLEPDRQKDTRTYADRREYRLKYYQDNKEKIQAKQRQYDASHKREIGTRWKQPCYKMLYSARERTRKLSLPECNLTLDYLRSIFPEYCPVFGIKLVHNSKPQPDSPSLDRIIPELGYTIGNVQILSNKANMMKQNATNEELLMFADWIKRNINNTNE